MPIKVNAKKALRQARKRTAINQGITSDIKTQIKKIKKMVETKADAKTINDALINIQKMIDKAAKKGVIKKNAGDRKKSRLMAYFHRGGAVKPEPKIKAEPTQAETPTETK